MAFAYFFLGEYGNIIGISAIISLLILGGYRIGESKSSIWLGIKTVYIIYIIIWVRAAMPRIRMDQIISLMWEGILPIVLSWLIMEISIMEVSIVK